MKQLWVLCGGNGAGKSTFFEIALAPRGVKLVNADVIAKIIRNALLLQGTGFCFETVFSHPSKIDFIARAKGLGYEVILVYVHLCNPQLNEARVQQRVSQGGHNVPVEKIHSRIPRTMRHVRQALALVDEARLLDNSLRDDPFRQIAIVRKGRCVWTTDPVPDWAHPILRP